jgi:16S rRNA (adenine1518-N6/adenine1519-N6)-dimethyltransferase
MNRGQLHQKKSLGQVFLRTEWPIQRVVEKCHQWKVQRVLEIGPGEGVLTKGLIKDGFQVTAVERDDRFAERLPGQIRRSELDEKLLHVVPEDILKFDLGAWLDSSKAPAAVVGNIPYNISSPILLWLLPHLDRLAGGMLMVQLEFGQRIAAGPGNKDYGSLSVYTQMRSKVTLECKVDRTSFFPVPKVDSALITLTAAREQYSPSALNRVELLSRTSFLHRRKMLRNTLQPFFNEQHPAENSPIDLNRRPETLRIEEFLELARYLFPKEF